MKPAPGTQLPWLGRQVFVGGKEVSLSPDFELEFPYSPEWLVEL